MKNSKQLYFEMPNKKALGIEDYIITNSNNFAFDLIVKNGKRRNQFWTNKWPFLILAKHIYLKF